MLLLRPLPGRGQCLRYQGSSRIRGGAGRPPCPALLQDLPMCWTVGISPLGVGLTGRGNSFPLPCLPDSNHLASRRSHPGLRQRIPIYPASSPRPTRACGAPPPPPPGGRVRAWRYQGSNRIRGGTGGQPCSALLQDLPMCWTVGNIATGGGGLRGGSLREGGTRSPSPVSRAQNALLLRHPHLPEGGQRPADLMHPASPGAQGSAARRSAGGYPLKKARAGRVTPRPLPPLPQPQEPRDLPLLPPGAGTSLS